ncbi:MAG: hypothetical protein RLZZ428_22 [Pseudomonadota bacterium]|jgi:hypothetical protein
MQEPFNLELKQSTVENLDYFSKLLNKDVNTILEEALGHYFQAQRDKLNNDSLFDEGGATNLDFDEFWDDVDL